MRTRGYDAVIVGSGYGGAMVAHRLVQAGAQVLMLERGGWIERGAHNRLAGASLELLDWFEADKAYRPAHRPHGVRGYRPSAHVGSVHCVGGPSVFAGTVAMRFRAEDFAPPAEIVGSSGARWPLRYEQLADSYAEVERLLGVAGSAGEDPTEPPREDYPVPSPALEAPARRIAEATRRLGLRPFPLPLAIDFDACDRCPTCDTFACSLEAKRDLAVAVLRPLLGRGLDLRTRTNSERLVLRGDRVAAVRARDLRDGSTLTASAPLVVLAAGALATPHLLLASGAERHNPAGWAVGRFLTRHCNAVVMGVWPRRLDGWDRFHKHVGVHDFYFGDEASSDAGDLTRLGSIQQVATPPAVLFRAGLPLVLRPLADRIAPRLTGLLAMAEDQPRAGNRVTVDPRETDPRGMPRLVIDHRHSERDRRAREALVRRVRRILWEAGARRRYVHRVETFSHALGTVRMGDDPSLAPLDRDGCFRGLENLHVVDGSCLPTSAAVNPSLTIAANALRVGGALAGAGAAGGDHGFPAAA